MTDNFATQFPAEFSLESAAAVDASPEVVEAAANAIDEIKWIMRQIENFRAQKREELDIFSKNLRSHEQKLVHIF